MDQERKDLAAANRLQEEAKSDLKDATTAVNNLAGTAEISIGQKLDRAIAAVGKRSSIGKEGLEIRARINRVYRKTKPETPTP